MLVKWPLVGQFIARQDVSAVRQLIWPRLWLQVATYTVMAIAAIAVGPFLIRFIGSDKEMLPLAWIALLAANGFLETHCSLWTTLISMWNKLPMLWAPLATNAAALVLNLALVNLPNAHPGLLGARPTSGWASFIIIGTGLAMAPGP